MNSSFPKKALPKDKIQDCAMRSVSIAWTLDGFLHWHHSGPGVKSLFTPLASNGLPKHVWQKPQSTLSAARGANASPRTNPATNP